MPYSVEAIEASAARQYVIANHYSRSYVADRLRFGLFRHGALVGVAVLGDTCTSRRPPQRLSDP